jgi:hypothetical protein
MPEKSEKSFCQQVSKSCYELLTGCNEREEQGLASQLRIEVITAIGEPFTLRSLIEIQKNRVERHICSHFTHAIRSAIVMF